jgi:hypothetical protein
MRTVPNLRWHVYTIHCPHLCIILDPPTYRIAERVEHTVKIQLHKT